MRARMKREDKGEGPHAVSCATIMGFNPTGCTTVVFDDMYWAGYRTDSFLDAIEEGEIQLVEGTDDGDNADDEDGMHVAMFINRPGAPPDSFFFGETELNSGSWRWFECVRPAPPSGTFGQSYAPSRLSTSFSSGAEVTVTGRVTRIVAAKRGEKKAVLDTRTVFTVMGFVQGTLPTQHLFWAVLSFESVFYVAALFSKDGECHLRLIRESHPSSLPESNVISQVQVSVTERLRWNGQLESYQQYRWQHM